MGDRPLLTKKMGTDPFTGSVPIVLLQTLSDYSSVLGVEIAVSCIQTVKSELAKLEPN